MKKLLLFFILISCISFCQENYFPLQVGNYWQYKVKRVFMSDTTFSYNFTEIIGDTIFSASSSLYYKIRPAFTVGLLDTIQYLRFDPLLNSIIEFDSLRGGESTLFKLDAVQNECWDYFGNQVCYGNIDTLEVFGDNKLVKDFYRSSSTPPWWGYNLAEDFGPISIYDNESWGFIVYSVYDLIYAKINGIEYGQLVSVSEENSEIPTELYLYQNYPNPFNPSTKISWQSPLGSWQTLKVFDVLGNEVATLVNEYRPAGSYEVEFKATISSHQLANGIYFYRLQAGDPSTSSGQSFIETRKMVLLK